MLCKDAGITVKDDYSNIDELEIINLFEKNLMKDLRRLTGLRNALVHRYNKIEEKTIINEKENFIIVIKKFVQEVERLIVEKYG